MEYRFQTILNGTQYYIKEVTPDQARQELNTLNPILEELFDLKNRIEKMRRNIVKALSKKPLSFVR